MRIPKLLTSLTWSSVILASLSAVTWGDGVPVSGAPPLPDVVAGGTCGPGVPKFIVQKGFSVSLAIKGPTESRFMEFDEFGHLYLSAPKAGTITTSAIQPDHSYKAIADIVTGKRTAHGMCIFDGWLWYTTSGGIFKGKIRADGSGLDDLTTIIPEDGTLPSGGAHWWRPILVDKDGFYTSMGDPDNASDQRNTDREKVWRYSLDGKTRTLFCSGIRNTEKLRFRPDTEEVWGLDHGSDDFGMLIGDAKGHQPITDRIPGEEVNHYEAGKFYGHPFVVDANLVRPEYVSFANIEQIKARSIPPVYMFPAHFADNGWTWLSKPSAFGKRGDMCITSHGSWNSTAKVGYCVSLLQFDPNGKPVSAQRIVDCLDPKGAKVLGRPVDAVEEPGTDNLLFSVDFPGKGCVYRISPEASK